MSAFRLAHRYAKSLIQLAQDKGKLADVNQSFRMVDAAFESSRELKLFFKSPIITADKKLAVTKKLFEGKVDSMVYDFIVLLIKKGREPFLHDIAESFVEQYNSIVGITPVSITTAVPIDKSVIQSIIEALKKKEGLKDVELTETVDESLIGGFVLKYSDKMIDSSIKNQLAGFRKIVDDNSYIKKY